MKVWICFDEERVVYGVFNSELGAKQWADRFNSCPEFDGVVKVLDYDVACEDWLTTEYSDICFKEFMKIKIGE
jgi:hypothetical protein